MMSDQSIRRLPPYSGEAERGVLGSILIDSSKVLDLCAQNAIVPDSFYIPAHRQLFDTLLEMAGEMKVVDLLTVGQHLSSESKIDAVGGYEFLEGLIDGTPTAAHAEYYIGFVRQKHLLRKIIDQATQAIDNCYTETEEAAEDILSRFQSNLFEVSTSTGMDVEKSVGEVAADVCDRWQEIIEGKTIFGLPPFIPELAELLGNFVPGNPYFIAAPPGGGKSVILQNQLVFWSLIMKVPTAFASLEMTKEKLVSRMIAERSGVSAWAMDNCKFGSGEYAFKKLETTRGAAAELNNMPLYIKDTPMDVDAFCAWGMRQKIKYGIKAIGLDYFQLLDPPAKLRLTGTEAVKYVCGKLQNFTKTTGIITLVLSQITKLERDNKGNTRKPKQDDLYGGRIIDATSEGTLFVWQNEGLDYIVIDKNRNGVEGDVEVYFEKKYNRFRSVKPEGEI